MRNTGTGTAEGVPVRFLDLGPLLVEVDGRVRAPGGPRTTAALAVLLVHAGRPVSVDTLGHAIWGDGRPRSVSTLESHLWRLRQVLEPHRRPGEPWSLLVTEPGGDRLCVATEQVDSLRFAALVEEAGALLDRGGRRGGAAALRVGTGPVARPARSRPSPTSRGRPRRWRAWRSCAPSSTSGRSTCCSTWAGRSRR